MVDVLEGLEVFHEHFRRLTGLTPSSYAGLRTTRAFNIALPEGYPLPYLRRALGRDPQSITERLHGDVYLAVVQLSTGPALLELRLSPSIITASISTGSAIEAHSIVTGLLGLDQDAAAFSRLARKLGLARLVDRKRTRLNSSHSAKSRMPSSA